MANLGWWRLLTELMPNMLCAPSPGTIAMIAKEIFPASTLYSIERVDEGMSTYVYRITGGSDTLYLRILPEEGASFAPEARAHELLREREIKVPEIMYVEHLNEDLQRSIMVTTEIAGEHVGHCSSAQDIRNVLIEAGRDLAVINSIPVDGFGWIKRDRAEVVDLEAEYPSYRTFALEGFDTCLATIGGALSVAEIATIRGAIGQYDNWLDVDQARLAHGDFDVTHIFQRDGRYSGIIDFGEIRGGDPFYDLGHFRLHDGERLPVGMLSYLLEGYGQVTPLPPDHERRIRFSSLLIGVRWLARMMTKFPEHEFHDHQAATSIRRALKTLAA